MLVHIEVVPLDMKFESIFNLKKILSPTFIKCVRDVLNDTFKLIGFSSLANSKAQFKSALSRIKGPLSRSSIFDYSRSLKLKRKMLMTAIQTVLPKTCHHRVLSNLKYCQRSQHYTRRQRADTSKKASLNSPASPLNQKSRSASASAPTTPAAKVPGAILRASGYREKRQNIFGRHNGQINNNNHVTLEIIPMMKKNVKLALGALIRLMAVTTIIGLCSCISPYNAQSHKNLTDLKAYHLKFIDTFTTTSDTAYSIDKVKDWREKGDLQFRQAETFSVTLKDPTRTQNFIWLHEDFTEDAAHVLKARKLLTITFADELKKETTRHYDTAIKGEKVRNGAPE